MTRKGWFIFTDYVDSCEKLEAMNHHGKIEYSINLSTPYAAFDVEIINDNTVAVTTGSFYKYNHLRGVSVVDLSQRKVIEFIDLPEDPYGIKYDGTSLICCVKNKDLHVISFKDYSITTIPNTVSLGFSYVSTHADKILYTNPKENTVYCCLYDGTPVWEFHDESVLKVPEGITVDDEGNVFVVGCESCNVLIISPEGKHYKQILNNVHVNRPHAIFLDKSRNQLLMINHAIVANLYNISYS
ncbi:unnamed protein product [Mytilus coruscus]|uniref:Uncharacterized protein n=1 Tax=Mytilus coruscus TaxID=42192 RepID=A0A6J8CW77_MYTCO|nr:unnamed protein product [Mytilus coruscus]